MDLKQFGFRLKKLRLDHHREKTHIEFEAISGVSRGSIDKIEQGTMKFGPGIVTIERWLKACGTNLREFFGATSSADIKDLPFQFQPQDTEFHQMLADILKARDRQLSEGIYVNLRAISREAREKMLAEKEAVLPGSTTARASPHPPNGGEKHQGRVSRPRRPKARRILRRKNEPEEKTGT